MICFKYKDRYGVFEKHTETVWKWRSSTLDECLILKLSGFELMEIEELKNINGKYITFIFQDHSVFAYFVFNQFQPDSYSFNFNGKGYNCNHINNFLKGSK